MSFQTRQGAVARAPEDPGGGPAGRTHESTDRACCGASFALRSPGELLESEERFCQFMNNCPAAAFIKDIEGRYLWVNAYIEALYDRPAGDWIGHLDHEILSPDEAARLRENDRVVLGEKRMTSFTETLTVKGERRDYLTYKFLLQHADRTFIGGMSVDITEQVRARDEVRRLAAELEARASELQALLDVVPVAIFMAHDPTCRRITGNRAASDLTATSLRANLSLTAALEERPTPHRVFQAGRELTPPELPIQRAAQGVEIGGEEYELLFEDGSRKCIFGYASPLYDGAQKVRGSVAAFVDITDRKAAEASLERRSRRLQLLWEAARVLMTVQDPDEMARELFTKIRGDLGLDVYYNYVVEPGGDRMRLVSSAGLPPETLAALATVEITDTRSGRSRDPSEAALLADAQRCSRPMTDAVRALGVQALVSTPLLACDRLLGTLSFGSRARREFSPEDVEFLQTISHHVAVAYERLRLIEQLRDADRRKDDFLATLAHELRNPLAPIRNAVQILKAKGPEDPTLTWSRDVIDRQVHHMARLLEDLLDVSRISREKLELRKERVDIASVIDVAVETSRPLIDANRHKLVAQVPPGSLRVDGDPVRLAQVFANLLNNAAKYTPERGTIAISVRREGRDVVVSVKDDGIGIRKEMLPRVFDMFSQAEPALGRSQGGLGIGLSLVKGLVELHGGTVTAQSEGQDRGSEFTVRLPLLSAGDDPTESGGPSAASAAKHRVLVVDDNVDSADSLAALLEIMGCEVMTAYNGEDALTAAEAFQPTVMLLDIGMPRMTGYEVCRRAREQPWGRRLFVVAMTGWGRAEDRCRTKEAGFDHHLVKPVDTSALLALLGERAPFPPA